ncbi:MAG: glycosyltransferase family 39 protein [Acidobacteriota bacterium]|nr:glycosyltransferase family 39 protein [Acidobacteriota bacterium]
MKTPLFFVLLFALLLGARLCHLHVLWAEEDLPLAAAKQMLAGKMLYRDIWFDKPPLVSAIYLLWGAKSGWVLRFAGALYALLACFIAYAFARDLWTRREGLCAAALLAFFLIFDTPSAALPLAADLLMLVPHLAAVYLAWRGQAFWSGALAGIAFLFNAKAIFVLAACAMFGFPALLTLAAGFMIPNAIALGWLWLAGALPAYIDQVWVWPSLYARNPFLSHPVWNGLVRTMNWMGFHAAIVIAAVVAWKTQRLRLKMLGWLVLSAAGVILGWRFFPRYFFQILPVFVILASRGFVVLERKRVALGGLVLLLVAPLIRFGPRYAMLAANPQPEWSDTAMDRDSREAARLVISHSRSGDTLFVWGFRPEIFVYTGLPAATRYLDSQALTGVPADRHLTQSAPVLTESTKAAREELARSRPTIVVDGLSVYNPKLAMGQYPELRKWLISYREVARTRTTIIYHLR